MSSNSPASTQAGATSSPEPLLPLRTALILTMALLIAGVAGGLAFWAQGSVPTALISGLSAGALAVLPLDKCIGR